VRPSRPARRIRRPHAPGVGTPNAARRGTPSRGLVLPLTVLEQVASHCNRSGTTQPFRPFSGPGQSEHLVAAAPQDLDQLGPEESRSAGDKRGQPRLGRHASMVGVQPGALHLQHPHTARTGPVREPRSVFMGRAASAPVLMMSKADCHSPPSGPAGTSEDFTRRDRRRGAAGSVRESACGHADLG
jgi:hypothetical protein